MLGSSIRAFVRDESGGYTIWSLLWFMLYVCIGGLAVDVTDGYRNQTLLQSTADAAALAGVMSLPNESDAVAKALAYSADNMDPEVNGEVLKDAEVFVGTWDSDSRTFTAGGSEPDAVRVITRRDASNANPLGTNFLRIIGLWRFNINVEAVAVRYVPGCIRAFNSFVAGNRVDITSNNTLMNTCVHGQNLNQDPAHDYSVEIQNNGTIGTGTAFTMPNTDDMIDRPTVCSNEGLCQPGVVIYGDMMPADAFLIGDTLTGLVDPSGTSADLPDDLYSIDAETNELVNPDYEYITLGDCESCVEIPPPVEYDPITGEVIPPDPAATTYEYTGTLDPNRVYVVSCSNASDQFILPSADAQPVLQNVAVLSACRISGQAGTRLEGVLLASSATGNGKKWYEKSTVHFPAGVSFGAADNCAAGGGVRIYSAGSVHISASPEINGLEIVARGDVELTANGTADGINVQAGHDIKFTANADIGTGCSGETEITHAWHYRLVL